MRLPEPVRHPVTIHNWDWLTFLHWRYPPDVVQGLLPPGLEVETFDGAAWVGLVPFRMRIRFPRGPAIPWASTFPETNVRTYVRGPDSKSGIWFFSLEAARLGAVLAARVSFGLPYMWAHMEIVRSEGGITYRSRRRWPGPGGARFDVSVVPAEPLEGLGPLEDFLVSRFRLYSATGSGLHALNAQHEPWKLRRASVIALSQDLAAAAGLPQPTADPLAHFAEGVEVRIGAPSRLSPPSRTVETEGEALG